MTKKRKRKRKKKNKKEKEKKKNKKEKKRETCDIARLMVSSRLSASASRSYRTASVSAQSRAKSLRPQPHWLQLSHWLSLVERSLDRMKMLTKEYHHQIVLDLHTFKFSEKYLYI